MVKRVRVVDLRRQDQQGFTYVILLIAVVVLSIGLAFTAQLWSAAATHQRLVQLQWVGDQYVKAIGSYYQSSTGTVKVYPRTLQDLLEDRRLPVIRRHLRQLYNDPLTDSMDWELQPGPNGTISGVSTVYESQRFTFAYAPSF